MSNNIVTVFTPTYNRLRTLTRTYNSLIHQTNSRFRWIIIDDGSFDGTKEWVENLAIKKRFIDSSFDWMGRKIEKSKSNHFVFTSKLAGFDSTFDIEYVYKPNGGLYTGYNVAIQLADTELCVCIDSDDYMPTDAIQKIILFWKTYGNLEYAGIDGLDLNAKTGYPIGGYFPRDLKSDYLHNISIKKYHGGDVKLVLRTDLLKNVAPMIGFPGEKNFNPIYLVLKVCDKLPLLVMNDVLCIVDYQFGQDSMSEAIFYQYKDSPRSFAKLRVLEMSLVHNSLKDRFRSAIHYVSSWLFYRDTDLLQRTQMKMLIIAAFPFGLILHLYIRYKNIK